jgi:hypothetical protein
VIAPSFADIFYNNCFKNGILPIVLPQEDVDKLMDDAERGANAVVTVDLESQTITGPDGGSITFDIDPFRKHCLLNGLDDIGLTMEQAASIDTFEAQAASGAVRHLSRSLTQSWTEWDIQRTDSKTTKLDETGFEIEVEYVLTQLVGAMCPGADRHVVVIATPSLLIPGTTPEGTQVVTLVALALGIFVGMEYAATYPGLVEFRDAPPFNRVRILTLFAMLFLLSLVVSASPGEGSSLALIVNAFGLLVATTLDFPFSPVQMIGSHLPPGLDPFAVNQIKAMAGIATLVMLFSIFCFALLIRLNQWPNRGSSFNVWINLPTFDPTTGGDVVKRLRRDSLVNVILGVFAPFVLPVVAVVAANHIEINVLSSPHALVWGITLWMFIPLSMLMRGLAMSRVADMIGQRRARLTASVASDGPSSPALVALAAFSAPATADTLRLAVFHTALSRDGPGLLLRDIVAGDDAQVLRDARGHRRRGCRYLLLLDMDFDAGPWP